MKCPIRELAKALALVGQQSVAPDGLGALYPFDGECLQRRCAMWRIERKRDLEIKRTYCGLAGKEGA